jgi:hypothetical protein
MKELDRNNIDGDLVIAIDLIAFYQPCFNPNNPDEFVCYYQNITRSGAPEHFQIIKYNLKTKTKTVLIEFDDYNLFTPRHNLLWTKSDWIIFNDILTQDRLFKLSSDGKQLIQLTYRYSYSPIVNQEGDLLLYATGLYSFMINLSGEIIDTFSKNDGNNSGGFGICDWSNDLIVSKYISPDYKDGLAVYNLDGKVENILFSSFPHSDDYNLLDIELIGNINNFIYSWEKAGIYKYSNGENKVIKKDKTTSTYGLLSVSSDKKHILAEKTIYKKYEDGHYLSDNFIVIMDIDGRNEERLEIPE